MSEEICIVAKTVNGGQSKSPQRELLLKHIFYIITHFIMGFYVSGAIHDGFLFRFRQLGKTIQNVGMLCKLHRKADGKFLVIYHAITPEIGCAGLADNMRGKEWNQEDLEMYGYIGGITDTDEINFCPYCGEEITTMHAGGTVTCGSCKRRFGVVELDEEE